MTSLSSSDMIAWSTCHPVTRWGSTTEPILFDFEVVRWLWCRCFLVVLEGCNISEADSNGVALVPLASASRDLEETSSKRFSRWSILSWLKNTEFEHQVPLLEHWIASNDQCWMHSITPQLSRDGWRFSLTSEDKYGKSFSQLKEETGGDEAWIETLPNIHALGEVVKASAGPFVRGETRELIRFRIPSSK